MAVLNFEEPNKVIYTTECGEDDFSTTDIVEICRGNVELAHGVASLCDWRHPETIIDEMLREGDIEEDGDGMYVLVN